MTTLVDSSGEFDAESHVYATCKQCNQSFDNRTNLAKHMFLHREGFICIDCNKPFASESGLKRHINANHKNAKPVPSCDICGQRFRIKRDLEKHHLACHRANKYFQCRFCGVEFSWLTNLQKHEQFHTSGGDQLNTDSTAVDSSKSQTDYSTKRKSANQNNACQEKSFKCQVCGKEFQFDFSYAIHLEGHQKALESDSSELNNSIASCSADQESHSKSSVEILLEVVPNENSGNGDEVVSVKAIGGNDLTSISECDGDVPTMSSDTSTMRSSILTDEEDIELFSYLKECKMRREIRMVRKRRPESPIYDCVMTEEKPFKCDLCGESFRWEVSLTIHAKVHVDGKALKFRKLYQRQQKPALRSRRSAKSVDASRSKDRRMNEDVESTGDEESNEVPNDDIDQDAPTSFAGRTLQDGVVSQVQSLTGIKDSSLAKADKFVERMTDVLKTKWNPANNRVLTSQKNQIIGQVVLLDSNNKRLSLRDGKLVSSDGTQYLVSEGLLYVVNSQSHPQTEEPVVSFLNDFVESSNYADVGQLIPDSECVIGAECDLSMDVTNA